MSEFYPPHIGGVEYVFQKIAEGAAEHKTHCVVLTTNCPGTRRWDAVNGVYIHRTKTANRFLYSVLAIPKAIKLAKECDIIHTTTYNAMLPAKIASLVTGKPCIVTVHEVFGGLWSTFKKWPMSLLFQAIEEFLINLGFNKYVAVSQYTYNCLRFMGIPDEKIQVIYNGVEDHSRTPSIPKKAKFVYLYYGRTGISKGVEYLIKAAAIVKKTVKNSKLVIITPKHRDNFDKIRRMARNLRLYKHVEFHDAMLPHQLFMRVKSADCIVIPSLSEGFGLTAAESSLLGKKIVATYAGSLPETVSGEHILVKPKDPEELAAAIIAASRGSLIKIPPIRIFTWENAVKSYLELYRSL